MPTSSVGQIPESCSAASLRLETDPSGNCSSLPSEHHRGLRRPAPGTLWPPHCQHCPRRCDCPGCPVPARIRERSALPLCAGPSREGRVVARVPGVAQPGRAEIPVGTDLARHGAQVMPEIDDRGAPRTSCRSRCCRWPARARARACAGIIGSCSGSVYSWMSRSYWTVRPGSDRKVHWAPTEARNPCSS